MRILTDNEITDLIAEPKRFLHGGLSQALLETQAHRLHFRTAFWLVGNQGHLFRVNIRQSQRNLRNFSIVLTYTEDESNECVLLRYDGGHSGIHTNRWEAYHGLSNQTISEGMSHIHRATERYQHDGFDIDDYAEATDAYTNFHGALEQFLREIRVIE